MRASKQRRHPGTRGRVMKRCSGGAARDTHLPAAAEDRERRRQPCHPGHPSGRLHVGAITRRLAPGRLPRSKRKDSAYCAADRRMAQDDGVSAAGHRDCVRRECRMRAVVRRRRSREQEDRTAARALPADQHAQPRDPSRCVGVSGRAGGAALAPVRGPARHRAAVARRRPPRSCEGAGDARGSRAFAFVLMVLAHRSDEERAGCLHRLPMHLHQTAENRGCSVEARKSRLPQDCVVGPGGGRPA